MIDANQRWDVQEAIDRVTALKEFKPLWVGLSTQTIFQIGVEFFTLLRHLQSRNLFFFQIEEPTKDDDILGHAKIVTALAPSGVRVATGEQCQNRIVFKQLMASKGVHFVQVNIKSYNFKIREL